MAHTPFNTRVEKNTTPGRPSWINRLVVLKQPDNSTGYKLATSEKPQAIQQAEGMYLTSGSTLPPLLTSQRMIPSGPREYMRRRAISKGWNNPKGFT